MNKKFTILLCVIAVVMFAVLGLTSCGGDQSPSASALPDASSLALIEDSVATTYKVGDSFAGGTIIVDGVETPITEEMLGNFDTTQVGMQTVTISYRGKTATFRIVVEPITNSETDQMAGVTKTTLDFSDEEITRMANVVLKISNNETSSNAMSAQYANDIDQTKEEVLEFFEEGSTLRTVLENSGVTKMTIMSLVGVLENNADRISNKLFNAREIALKCSSDDDYDVYMLKVFRSLLESGIITDEDFAMKDALCEIFNPNLVGTILYQVISCESSNYSMLQHFTDEQIAAGLNSGTGDIYNAAKAAYERTAYFEDYNHSYVVNKLQLVSAIDMLYSIINDGEDVFETKDFINIIDLLLYHSVNKIYQNTEDYGYAENYEGDDSAVQAEGGPMVEWSSMPAKKVVMLANTLGKAMLLYGENFSPIAFSLVENYLVELNKFGDVDLPISGSIDFNEVVSQGSNTGLIKFTGTLLKNLTVADVSSIVLDYQAFETALDTRDIANINDARATLIVDVGKIVAAAAKDLTDGEKAQFISFANMVFELVAEDNYDLTDVYGQLVKVSDYDALNLTNEQVAEITGYYNALINSTTSYMTIDGERQFSKYDGFVFVKDEEVDLDNISTQINNMGVKVNKGTVGNYFGIKNPVSTSVTVSRDNLSAINTSNVGQFVCTVSVTVDEGDLEGTYTFDMPYTVYSLAETAKLSYDCLNFSSNTVGENYFNGFANDNPIIVGKDAALPSSVYLEFSVYLEQSGYLRVFYDNFTVGESLSLIYDTSTPGLKIGYAVLTCEGGTVCIPFEYVVIEAANQPYTEMAVVGGSSDSSIIVQGGNLTTSFYVYKNYSDSSVWRETVTLEEVEVVGFDNTELGKQTVTFRYMGLECTDTYTVISAEMSTTATEIHHYGDVGIFKVGDTLNAADFDLEVIYGEGYSVQYNVPADALVYDFANVGWTTLQYKLGDLTYTEWVYVLTEEEANTVTAFEVYGIDDIQYENTSIDFTYVEVELTYGYGYKTVTVGAQDSEFDENWFEYNFEYTGYDEVVVTIGDCVQIVEVYVNYVS